MLATHLESANGWSELWGYRSRGHWRGGRPRVSNEIRHLIRRIARENFFWGAPPIHSELLMVGFTVSEATVSGYLRSLGRRPTQSWRTFIRNQASALRYREDGDEQSTETAGLLRRFYRATLMRSAAAQTAAQRVGVRLRLTHCQLTMNIRRTGLRFPQNDRGVTHHALRTASPSGGSRRAPGGSPDAALPIRSPPEHRSPALRWAV